MGLDKTTLETKIKEAFKKAKDIPAPKDPANSGSVQEQINAQLAKDLADAINTFVRSGAVIGITTEVRDANHNFIGNGTQTGTGSIQ